MLTDKHDRFLFWLEGSRVVEVANAVRESWLEGKPYTGEMVVNLRNKKKEFERLNNSFKEK
jgi:hypothetical protein